MEKVNIDNLPDIDQAVVSDTELIKRIDYTRPLTDYATASDIANFIRARDKVYEIDIKSLAVNGKVRHDEMEMYLQHPAYNSSTLKAALKSPLHLYYERESGWKEELEKAQKAKSHFNLGTFLHSCILEPSKFDTVIVEPDVDRTTTIGMQTLVKFWEDKVVLRGGVIDGKLKDGNTVIESARYIVEDARLDIEKKKGRTLYYNTLKTLSGLTAITDRDKLIVDAVKFNFIRYGGGILLELMKGALTEVSIYRTNPETGTEERIRPDGLLFEENVGNNLILSVKSTSCEDLAHFYYQTAKYKYELPEGMYLDVAEGVTGRPFTGTLMIMLQTVPPFGVAALMWNAEDLEIGKYKYRQALQTVADCEAAGRYPGYDVYAEEGNLGIIDMKQPAWNAKELFPTDVED